MIFGPKKKKAEEPKIKISEEEFRKEFRPLLVSMCKDCISKAKSMRNKYKMIEDIAYLKKDTKCDDLDKSDVGDLTPYIYEQTYTYFAVTLVDGSETARISTAALDYITEMQKYLYNKYKNKFTKEGTELIDVHLSVDGDDGTVYVDFHNKYLSFDPKDIKYTPIKESYNVFDNVKIL